METTGVNGSSPRERGTHGRAGSAPAHERFIPARAGNAPTSITSPTPRTVHPARAGNARRRAGRPSPSPVHPRASGERASSAISIFPTAGSSPRERGTRSRTPRDARVHRFIPARAGNAIPSCATSSAWTVHPRASGERATSSALRCAPGGSSPRERGTPANDRLRRYEQRFIPARAGNASRSQPGTEHVGVHPRASGERRFSGRRARLGAGSSPRERGTPRERDGGKVFQRFIPRERGTPRCPTTSRTAPRFIPARAGNAWTRPMGSASQTVHPRASGERALKSATAASYAGSSPRERGTQIGADFVHRLVRFIPARAGNALPRPRSRERSPVHPRASGERSDSAVTWTTKVGSSPRERERVCCSPRPSSRIGSSPRERGTLGQCRHADRHHRFIPARAGNAFVTSPFPRS